MCVCIHVLCIYIYMITYACMYIYIYALKCIMYYNVYLFASQKSQLHTFPSVFHLGHRPPAAFCKWSSDPPRPRWTVRRVPSRVPRICHQDGRLIDVPSRFSEFSQAFNDFQRVNLPGLAAVAGFYIFWGDEHPFTTCFSCDQGTRHLTYHQMELMATCLGILVHCWSSSVYPLAMNNEHPWPYCNNHESAKRTQSQGEEEWCFIWRSAPHMSLGFGAMYNYGYVWVRTGYHQLNMECSSKLTKPQFCSA